MPPTVAEYSFGQAVRIRAVELQGNLLAHISAINPSHQRAIRRLAWLGSAPAAPELSCAARANTTGVASTRLGS